MAISTILFVCAMVALITAIGIKYTPLNTQKQKKLLFGVGWILFAVFWMSRFEYYVFQTRSFIYLLLVPTATIACFTLGITSLHTIKTQNKLPTEYQRLTTSAALASVIYMPFTLIEVLRRTIIESVTYQTYILMKWLGVTNVHIGTGPEFGYQSALIFMTKGQKLVTYIAPNCTGIGSMAVVVAILAVTNLSVQKKAIYSVLSILLVHILNIGRNIMIAVGFGHQWFAFLEPTLTPILGYDDPNLVSFFIADKILAQLGSAAALLIIFYIFLKKFPELQTILQTVIRFVQEELRL